MTYLQSLMILVFESHQKSSKSFGNVSNIICVKKKIQISFFGESIQPDRNLFGFIPTLVIMDKVLFNDLG